MDFGRALRRRAPGSRRASRTSGHILGARLVACEIGGRRLVFSGDLGRYDVPIMVDPDPVPEADVLLVESTYGNRVHPSGDPAVELIAAVRRAAEQKGLAPDPRLRGGAGPGDPLRAAAPGTERPHPEPARLPRQSDGHPGHRHLRRPHRGARHRAEAGRVHRRAPVRAAALPALAHRGGVQAPQRHGGTGDHRGGQRHGHGRPHPPSPQAPPARSADHGALRRLPGRGHARPPAKGRRARAEDAGHDRPGARQDHGERHVLGARRSRRDPALARRVQPPARA